MAAKTSSTSLTAEQLRAALTYKRKTGVFTWRYRWDVPAIWNTRYAGKPAGWRHSEGYRIITIYDVYYRAHRLAWLYVTGEWPSSGEVDHIDTDRTNNAWTNLRDATRQQNSCNGPMRSTNTSGFKGVSRSKDSKGKDRWRASIRADYRAIHLGTFDTKEEAHAAYVEAAERLHREFARVT